MDGMKEQSLPPETDLCEAYEWERWTGQQSGPCPNAATHMESWFDEEGVEVWLCDRHGDDRPIDLPPGDSSGTDG